MQVTIEQFAYLMERIWHRYHTGPYRLDDPGVVFGLLNADYGVTGVYPGPGFDQILRDYVPHDWTERDPENSSTYLWETRARQSTIEPASIYVQQLMMHRARTGQEFGPGPDMSLANQILGDLEILGRSPAGALTYLTFRASGVESREAMNWARLGAQIFDTLLATRTGIIATGRAVSGNTGSTRDVHRLNGEHSTHSSRQVERTPAPSAPVPQTPRSGPIRTAVFPVRSPREIRQDLLRLARPPANTGIDRPATRRSHLSDRRRARR